MSGASVAPRGGAFVLANMTNPHLAPPSPVGGVVGHNIDRRISFSLACQTLYRLVGYESVKGLPSETNFFISDYKSLGKKCKFKGQAKNIYLFVSRTYGTISVFVLTSFSR